MAPVVSLPIREMQNLPDCTKRWADVEDTTPSPWTDYPFPEFKPSAVWPDTPYLEDAICDVSLSIKNPIMMELAENIPPTNGVRLQAADELAPISVEAAPAALTELLIPCATGPVDGPYVVLAQTCPAVSDVVQWPSFAIHQHNNTLLELVSSQQMQHPEQWKNAADVAAGPAQMDGHIAAQPSVIQVQSNMELRHIAGQCRPCAWFWRERGCRNGDDCSYCHLCPEGELKSRKKTKIAAMRSGALAPVTAKAQANGVWGLKLDSLIQETP